MAGGASDGIDYGAELRSAVGGDGASLTVPAEWEGFPGAAFGGFLAAAVLVAASDRTAHPRPLSLFSRYYRPAPVGRPVTLELQAERKGRSVEVSTARLMDGDRLLSSYSVAFGQDGESPLGAQAVPPVPPLVRPRPFWQHVEELGREAPGMMRRVGYRGETEGTQAEDAAAGWHLRSEWPAPSTADPAVCAAVSVMAIDAFVAPATMRANEWDLDRDWPVMMPSLDLTGWFYASDEHDPAADWLTVRTSVPVSGSGYAVGRTQVWSGERLVAEGMSQVALLPLPDAAGPAR